MMKLKLPILKEFQTIPPTLCLHNINVFLKGYHDLISIGDFLFV